MKKKRGMLIIFLALIIFSVLGVSASFWSEITGKATRDISLTVQAAPEIVYVGDIANRDLTGGATTQKTFEFYVYHSGGIKVLPGGAEPESNPIDSSNVFLTLTNKNSPTTQRLSSDVGLCTYIGDDLNYNTDTDSDSTGGDLVKIGTVPVRKYSCTVSIQYYDDYGGPGTENWDVEPFIIDSFEKKEGYEQSTGTNYQNSQPQPNRDTYFNRLQSSQVLGENPDFGTIDYQVSNIEPINPTGYPLIVENQGNTELNPITVTGYNIPGITDNTKLIQASWFKVDTSTPCTTGNSLIDSTIVESKLSPINHGASASKELKFCLTGITTAASPQDYSTAGGNSWIIDITYV